MEAATTEIQSPNPNPNQNPNQTLTDLPDEIQRHIHSFIPTIDSIRSSLVSRQWRSLWSRLPLLDFPYDLFPVNDGEPLHVTSHRFAELVDRALILRPVSPIRTFRLSFIFYHHFTSHLDSWLRCALTRLRARELHLDLFVDRQYHRRGDDSAPNDTYEFRFSLLRDACVERLSLTRVDLALPARMALGSVRSLFLEEASLTDEMWEHLIKGCPNLEDLELQNGMVELNLRICSTSLKKLKFGYFYDCDDKNNLEIDCPNLVSLCFDCVSFTQFRLKNAGSLVEFNVSMVHHYTDYYELWSRTAKLLALAPNVKRLNLQNWCFKLLTSTDSFPKNFMLHNLSLLELRTGYTQYDLVGMAAVLELCPNLETMILDDLHKLEVDESLPEEVSNKPVKLNMPRLKEVKMLKFFGSEDEIKFVTLLKKQGVVLQKITLFPIKSEGNSYHQYPPVVLRRKPRQCEVAGSSSP